MGSLTPAINLASIVLAPQLGAYHYVGGNNDDIDFGSAACATGGSCNGTIIESDTNLQAVPDIPEPATLSVLGGGLAILGTGLSRRMAATNAVPLDSYG